MDDAGRLRLLSVFSSIWASGIDGRRWLRLRGTRCFASKNSARTIVMFAIDFRSTRSIGNCFRGARKVSDDLQKSLVQDLLNYRRRNEEVLDY